MARLTAVGQAADDVVSELVLGVLGRALIGWASDSRA
jgi:hypothetical protein